MEKMTYDIWFRNLKLHVENYAKYKANLMDADDPNPDDINVKLLKALLKMREFALKDLMNEYQSLEKREKDENRKYDFESKWVIDFNKIMFTIANENGFGTDYLLPVALAFRDLIKFKILNTEKFPHLNNKWKRLLDDINPLIDTIDAMASQTPFQIN